MNRARLKISKTLILILLFVASMLGLFLFSLSTSPVLNFSIPFSSDKAFDQNIFWTLRYPRTVLAFLVGGALAVSGLSFQAFFKNPLADPYLIGVSGGAAVGLAIAVAFKLPYLYMPAASFASALVVIFFLYKLASHKGVLNTYELLLLGVVLNAFAFALIMAMNLFLSFQQSQQILYMLLGYIPIPTFSLLVLTAVLILTSTLFLMFRTKQLNVMALGEEKAVSLGLDLESEKRILFIINSVLVGASVCLCGMIGFVGLVVPHMARRVIGADHRFSMPMAFLLGGLLLSFCQMAISWLPETLPVGVMTAFVGAPLFYFILRKRRRLT